MKNDEFVQLNKDLERVEAEKSELVEKYQEMLGRAQGSEEQDRQLEELNEKFSEFDSRMQVVVTEERDQLKNQVESLALNVESYKTKNEEI